MTANEVRIDQLRRRSIQATLESIAVFMACIFVLLILPALLIRYVYAGQQLFEQPKLLDYIQVGAFVIGAAYFIYTMVMNWMREAQIRRLEKGVMMSMPTTPSIAESSNSMASALARTEKRRSVPATRTSKSKKVSRRK